jgi:F-type H+-transporting ATPase subunit c
MFESTLTLGALTIAETSLPGTGIGAGLALVGIAIGVALVVMGAAKGIGNIAANAVQSIARQPEAGGRIGTNMIIAAALIEGFTFFALIVAILLNNSVSALIADVMAAGGAH